MFSLKNMAVDHVSETQESKFLCSIFYQTIFALCDCQPVCNVNLNFRYLGGKFRNFIRASETCETNEHKNDDSSAGLFAFGQYV